MSDLDPDDFADLRKRLAKKWGPVTLGNVIQRVRVVFKFGWDNGLIDRPVRYGQGFKRPSRKVVRIDRARKGPKLFTADEVRALAEGALVVGTDGPALVRAGVQLRAMVLLGINCGFGNADCGRLPLSAVDLDAGMIDFPRPKTGIPRRCPLWPETVSALREALAKRPEPKDPADAGLVFLTKYGLTWAKDTADQTLAKEFGKLLRPARQRLERAGVLHAEAHLPHGRRRGEGPACRRLHDGPRGAAHERRLPGDDLRRAAAGRRRPRPRLAARGRLTGSGRTICRAAGPAGCLGWGAAGTAPGTAAQSQWDRGLIPPRPGPVLAVAVLPRRAGPGAALQRTDRHVERPPPLRCRIPICLRRRAGDGPRPKRHNNNEAVTSKTGPFGSLFSCL